ncbi:MAG: adenine deaminase [Candidatus Odinarchaeota archaeon]|nr:adenine deaminase [Candidatus Odinarchaeota archaeon]
MVAGRSKLWEVTKELVATALGRIKADLVIKNGTLVNVYTGELIENINVAVKGDRIAHIGSKIDHVIGDNTKVIDAKGNYLVPGFLDGHVHIESSMLLPSEFAKAVLPHGTTAVFADPHEIANVLGLKGIKLMLEDSKDLPLKVYIAIPSCVPASFPEFETAGASIGPKEVEEVLQWENVVALAEMMNYPGVLMGDDKVHGEIQVTLKHGKVVEGHYADPELDKKLSAYIAAGITSCHESTRRIDALERARRGIWAMIREGSAWHDLEEVIKAVTERRIDTRRIILVTDDRHPEDILVEGHIDHVVRRAIQEGVDPITAIQMVTVNTAEHYKVDLDVGGIAPAKFADILIVEDLAKVKISTVIANGKVVAKDGKLVVDIKRKEVPEWATKTMNVKRKLTPEDFVIKAPIKEGTVKAHVVQVIEAKVTTKHLIEEIPVVNYELKPRVEDDIAKAAVIERHHGSGDIGIGLVKGFGFKEGAIASTVAHDSHNLLVAGVNEGDMAFAANKLIDVGGGMVVVRNQEILGLVELPVAGLMSTEDAETVSEKVRKLAEGWRQIGRKMVSPFMTMALLSLSVLPELRITDQGIIDTLKFQKIPLILQ